MTLQRPKLVPALTQYLKEKRGATVHGGDLETFAHTIWHESEACKVRLREMTRPTHPSYNPMIEKVRLKGGCVGYRWRVEMEEATPPPEPLPAPVQATLGI